MTDKQPARRLLRSSWRLLKADKTNERARTLLGVTHLYAKFDSASAFDTMAEAIKTINRISEPDLTTTTIHQRIEGQTFAHYSAYEVAGFSLENAFRELAPFDLDRALLQAQNLESKSLRARAIVALSAFCLEKIEAQQKSANRQTKFIRIRSNHCATVRVYSRASRLADVSVLPFTR